jgi:translation initiation factor 2 subunit 2
MATELAPITESISKGMTDDIDLDIDFSKIKKKKSSKKAVAEIAAAVTEEEAIVASTPKVVPVEHVEVVDDEIPTYEEMLSKLYKEIKKSSPEMLDGAMKLKLKRPTLARIGTKRTAWTNFTECCETLKRTTDHVKDFILAELGATGSIDGDDYFIVKFILKDKHLETVIRKYMKEYVQCRVCNGYDTEMKREAAHRLNIISCCHCKSQRSVENIKVGYHATTKADRKAERNKD